MGSSVTQRFSSFLSLTQAVHLLSTSSALRKKTPHTIGKMSWIRMAERRKYLEQKMRDRVKTEQQLTKEEVLLRQEPQIEFLTTSRIHDQIDESVMHKSMIKSEVFLSKDHQTIICYHPPPKMTPYEYTKPTIARTLFDLSKHLERSFADDITSQQMAEGLQLRAESPRLWNSLALARLFKVKPDVIERELHYTEDQEKYMKAEQEFYDSMSVSRRKKFDYVENMERETYVRKSRGKDFADWFKATYAPPKPRAAVPPKIHQSATSRGSFD